MKKLLLGFIFLVTANAKAQMTVSVKAGAVYTNIDVVKNEIFGSFHDDKGKIGMYAGLQFDHSIAKRFSFYHGLQLQQKSFSFKRSYTDYFFEGSFKPVYFTLPVGVQYKLLNRNIPVTISAGAYWETGLAGKVKYSEYGWGPVMTGKRDIGFEKTFNHWENHDLARSGVGLKFGATVQFVKNFSVEFNYDHALQNMQPESTDDRLNARYRSLSVGVKYDLKRYK